jgi:bacterioferritin
LAPFGSTEPNSCQKVNIMKRDESIKLLNRAVADELQAVHQYMYFHFHLDDQGLGPLAMQFKRTAIEEMVHIERIAERILFLKGEIDLAPSGPVERITDPVAMMKKAMQMEEGSIVDYNNAAIECTKLADAVSKQLFESLITDEERHFDAFEKQADNIERFGQSYLALQSFQQSEPEPGA